MNMLSVDADCKRINQTQKSDCAEYTPGKDCCILKQHVLETNKPSWKIMASNSENAGKNNSTTGEPYERRWAVEWEDLKAFSERVATGFVCCRCARSWRSQVLRRGEHKFCSKRAEEKEETQRRKLRKSWGETWRCIQPDDWTSVLEHSTQSTAWLEEKRGISGLGWRWRGEARSPKECSPEGKW